MWEEYENQPVELVYPNRVHRGVLLNVNDVTGYATLNPHVGEIYDKGGKLELALIKKPAKFNILGVLGIFPTTLENLKGHCIRANKNIANNENGNGKKKSKKKS